MGKKEREQFTISNDPDIRTFKKTLYLIVQIGLLIIALSIINTLFMAFNYGYPVSSSTSYNYGFTQDTLFDSPPDTYENFTNYNELLNNTGNYYANYSFENEVGIDYTSLDFYSGQGTPRDNIDWEVISELDGHKEVLQFNDTNNSYDETIYTQFTPISQGIYEVWVRSSDVSEKVQICIANGLSSYRSWFIMSSDAFYYYDGSTKLIPSAPSCYDDTWYHIKAIWDCGANTIEYVINGISSGSLSLYLTSTSISYLYLFTDVANNDYLGYFDAIGFDFGNHYNATYSFNGEIGLTKTNIDFIDSITSTDSYYDIGINGSYQDHYAIMNFTTSGDNGASTYIKNNFDVSDNFLEFWFNYKDYGQGYYTFYMAGSTIIIYATINSITNNLVCYYGDGFGSNNYVQTSCLPDLWHHIKIGWNLTADKYSIWLDEVNIFSNYNFFSDRTATSMTYLRFQLDGFGGVNSGEIYIDAIGYSWDSNYDIGDNLIPYWYDTGDNILPEYNETDITQVEKWDFYHDELGNYDASIDPVPFWTETAGNQPVATNGEVITQTLYVSDGLVGIYHDFAETDGLLNITWRNKIGNMYPSGQPDAWYSMSIYSYDLTLITQVNITYDGTYYLEYYDGSSYNVLFTGMQQGVYYNYSLFIDDSLCTLIFDNNTYGIYTYHFSAISTNDGLGKISFFQHQISNNGIYTGSHSYTDYIGVYVNGTSLSNDYGSVELSWNVSSWTPHNHPYIDIGIEGNYSLTLTAGGVSETLRDFGIYTSEIETFYEYDFGKDYAPPAPPPADIFVGSNPYFTFTSNSSITVSTLKVYSDIILTDGTNEYFSDTTYYNLTSSNASFYFYNNKLYYDANFNETTGQYMYLSYDIYHFQTTNYTIQTSGLINQSGGFATLYANYESGYYTSYLFSNTLHQYNSYLTENQYLWNFKFLVTDDPDNDYNVSITGYLNNFTISYAINNVPIIPTVSNWLSIITIVLIIFPVPLIVFIRLKKRYPDDKHEMLAYLIAGIIGCTISTIMFFSANIMPLYVYITFFISFLILILPSMLNRYLTLGLMFVSLMVYGGYFNSWFYVIMLIIVSFTTILTVRKMEIGVR